VIKIEEVEEKIHRVVEAIGALRRENQQLKIECDSLRSHISLLTGENNKAQKILADFDLLRKKHDQVAHRVERALTSLNSLRSA
jgi:hypothetical protein